MTPPGDDGRVAALREALEAGRERMRAAVRDGDAPLYACEDVERILHNALRADIRSRPADDEARREADPPALPEWACRECCRTPLCPDHRYRLDGCPGCAGTGDTRRREADPSAREKVAEGRCDRPLLGWACNLPAGHEGPCPTVPDPVWVREAARTWLADWTAGATLAHNEAGKVLRALFVQPRDVQDAIRDLLAGDGS